MAFDRHRLAARAGTVLRPAAAATVALSACALSVACGEKMQPEKELPAFIVKLDRTDGFSFDEHLVVADFRRASIRFRYRGPSDKLGTRRFTLSQAQFDSVTDALTALDPTFPDLRERYEGSEASEAVTDSITFRGRTVVVEEAALKRGSVPRPLARVLSRLNRLLDSKLETPRNLSP